MLVQYQVRIARSRIFLVALVTLVSVPGCDEKQDPSSKTGAAASPSALASALGLDAAALAPELVDPARPAGDLKSEADAFHTIEECMQSHGKSDPVVADALDHMGYDTLVRDACTVLAAVNRKDPQVCTGIDAGALRSRCRALVAITLGKPDQCPMRYEGKSEYGREARCVAAAARTPALCMGDDKHDRPACDAIAARDPGKCKTFLLDEEKERCAREAQRLASTLEGGTPLFGELAEGKGSLELHGANGTADPATTNVDLGLDVATGVVVVQERKGLRFRFGSSEANVTVRAVGPALSASFGATLGVSITGDVDVREAHVSVPGAASLTCPSVKCELKAKLGGKLEPKRGAPVTLTIDGVIGTAPTSYKVHAEVKTFARDVVDESTF
jgi:hypothetical protein